MKKLLLLIFTGWIIQNTKAVETPAPCNPQYPYTAPNYFVSSDDYENVNTNRFFNDIGGTFNMPTGFFTAINEYKYLMSTMRLSVQIKNAFASSTSPNIAINQSFPNYPSSTINANNFLITKSSLQYGFTTMVGNPYINDNDDKLHLIFIRPNDNIQRPCVFLTNGAGEFYRNEWGGTILLAADLAMRGYAVCVYENFYGSNKALFSSDFYCTGPGAVNSLTYAYYTNAFPFHTIKPANAERTSALASLNLAQVGIAAEQFILGNNNSNRFNIDVNRMYSMGGSAGAAHSLNLGYCDDNSVSGNVNFNNTTYGLGNDINKSISQIFGGITAKSRFPNEMAYQNGIKGVISAAGGLLPTNQYVGNLLDPLDINCPTLFLHALIDAKVDIFLSGSTNNIPGLFGPANPNLTAMYVNNGIKLHTYVNCDVLASHPFFTVFNEPYINYDFTGLSTSSNNTITNAYNNPNSSSSNLILFHQTRQYTYLGLQILSTGKIIANFLKRTTSTTNPIISNVSFFIKPSTTRETTSTPVPNYRTGDFFPTIDNSSYPNGILESTSHSAPCGSNSTILIPNSVGCLPIPNTIFGGWLHNQISGARQANPSPSPSEFKITNLPFIYPNPTSGKLNINLKLDNVINGYNVSIFSVDGKNIYNNTVNETLEAGTIINNEFDISNQANGIYFIRVTSENNLLLNQKFVLNK